LEHDGDNDDDPLEDGLVFRLDIAQAEDVVEDLQDQRADNGPADRADAAHQVGAADDDGGDRVQLVALPIDMAALADERGVEQRRDADEEPGDGENGDPYPVDVDAREPGGGVVASHRVDVSTETGPAEHE